MEMALPETAACIPPQQLNQQAPSSTHYAAPTCRLGPIGYHALPCHLELGHLAANHYTALWRKQQDAASHHHVLHCYLGTSWHGRVKRWRGPVLHASHLLHACKRALPGSLVCVLQTRLLSVCSAACPQERFQLHLCFTAGLGDGSSCRMHAAGRWWAAPTISEQQLEATRVAIIAGVALPHCCAYIDHLVYLQKELARQCRIVHALQWQAAAPLLYCPGATYAALAALADTLRSPFTTSWSTGRPHLHARRQTGRAAFVQIAVKQLLQNEFRFMLLRKA